VRGGDGQDWAYVRDEEGVRGWLSVFTIDKPRNGRARKNQEAVQLPVRPAKERSAAPDPAVIELARLPEALPEPPPSWANGTRLDYRQDGSQWVKVVVKDDGSKAHIPHHKDESGKTISKGGPKPWPLWSEAMALEHGPGKWIVEAEGEKCARWFHAGGLVAVSQPGHDHKAESIQRRYGELVAAGVAGVAYLADNDKTGKEKAKRCAKAAAAAGLLFINVGAIDVWPWEMGPGGSIDDAKGSAAERVAQFKEHIRNLKPEPPAEEPAGGQGGEEPQRESVPATFRELIESAYKAVLADDLDSEMAAAAELKTRFRATDQQISRRMIEAHLARRVKKTATQGDGVDLGAVQALTYRQDGFTIAGDVCLTYGSFGTGKTTYTVAKIIALCRGEGFLDRSAPCEPGKALFIATDSGAPALKKTLADLEIDPNTHPLFKGPQQRIWIWAHAPEQGHEAWVCDLRGLVKLEQFIEEKGIDLVVIDSAKSVSSGAGWQYTDNDAVKVLLRYMREAVAAPTGCSVEFISHDGTQAGSHSGAKAWAEDPSMVVALIPIKENSDDAKITGIRAEFKKDRAATVDPRRFVRYRLTEGRLELVEGSEVVGNCADGVLQILSEAHARGHQSLTAKAIDEEAFALLKATSKTVRNTLVQLVNAKRLVKPAYGRYALSPGEMQARGTPLRPSREESPQNTGQERAKAPSRPDSRRESREGVELPEDSRRESTGKVRESSNSKGSKEILPDKRGLGTPPAAAATDPPLVELVEVPPPPQQPALLATALAPIGSGADVMDSDDNDPHWGPRPEVA
jgi:hypothetical protein